MTRAPLTMRGGGGRGVAPGSVGRDGENVGAGAGAEGFMLESRTGTEGGRRGEWYWGAAGARAGSRARDPERDEVRQ